ncbi:nuclease-related domain-containing protein [Sphingomonas sp. HH69]
MILKPSNKSDELAEVISFVDDPSFTGLPAHVRKAALARKKGIEGEKYTAHILDRKFFNLGDHALIHDLRIPDGIGGYAQFDHVALSRLSRTASIFEVKNYGGRLSRNAHDEWMLWYEGRRRPVSIANPLAQVRRQREVLRNWMRDNRHDKAFEQIGVFVIMPPGCEIDRKAVTADFSVYKADNVIAEWNQFGGISPLGKLFSIGVSQGSLRAIGVQLAAAHVPDGKTLHQRLRGTQPAASTQMPTEGTEDRDDAAISVSAPEPELVPPESSEGILAPSPAPARPTKAREAEALAHGISQKILADGRLAFFTEPGNEDAAARLAAVCEGHGKWNRQYRNWLCDAAAGEIVRACLIADPFAAISGSNPERRHVEQG